MEQPKSPFEQFRPKKEPPQEKVEAEVMGNIHLKSYLLSILEMFTAIFGMGHNKDAKPKSDSSSEKS
jgi:hypothetical protein